MGTVPVNAFWASLLNLSWRMTSNDTFNCILLAQILFQFLSGLALSNLYFLLKFQCSFMCRVRNFLCEICPLHNFVHYIKTDLCLLFPCLLSEGVLLEGLWWAIIFCDIIVVILNLIHILGHVVWIVDVIRFKHLQQRISLCLFEIIEFESELIHY